MLPVIVTAVLGRVVGVDSTTGAVVFSHPVAEVAVPLGIPGLGTQSLKGVTVKAIELLVTESRIFAAAGQVVHCFEYPTGRPIGAVQLRHENPAGARATMLPVGDDIYVGIGTHLHRLTQNGQIVWSATLHEQENLVASVAIGVPGALRQADG